MLIVVVILCILAVVLALYFDFEEHEGIVATSATGSIILGIIGVSIIIDAIICGFDMFTIDDKIKLYQEENKNIETEITTIVNNYQGYEKEIISNIADMEVLLIKIPELKSSELVNKQMDLYIKNNDKIKELKERKIDDKKVKWLLYFGK